MKFWSAGLLHKSAHNRVYNSLITENMDESVVETVVIIQVNFIHFFKNTNTYVAQWVERLSHNRSVVYFSCFLEQEILPSLLSTG